MHGADAGSTARQDLAALGDELPELRGILIIYIGALIHAELAYLLALAILAPATAAQK